MSAPKLRFKGFNEDWKENRLEDYFIEFRSGKTITSKTIFENGSYPVYGGNGLRGYSNEYTHNGNYFLIGRQGALCGNITDVQGKCFISEHAIACKANNLNSTNFFSQKLKYINLNRLSESSAQPGLAVNKLLRLKIYAPNLIEQEKIAGFFTVIDKKLNLLKEKKEKLELYKKGVMQQIFSQKLRFKDEKGNEFPEWEEKKLGEIGEIITGKTPSTTNGELWNGEVLFVTPTDLSDDKFQYKSIRTVVKTDKLRVLPSNSIMFTCIASIGKMSLSTKPSITNQQINSIVPSEKYNNEYIYYALFNIVDFIKSTQSSSTLPIINKTEFSKFKIKIPKGEEEQQKIADFLSTLDTKINQVSTQIEKTELWKKGLLQQMFV